MTRLWDAVTVAPSTIARVAAEQYVPILPEAPPRSTEPRRDRPDVDEIVSRLRAEGYRSIRVSWGAMGFIIEARNRPGSPETFPEIAR